MEDGSTTGSVDYARGRHVPPRWMAAEVVSGVRQDWTCSGE